MTYTNSKNAVISLIFLICALVLGIVSSIQTVKMFFESSEGYMSYVQLCGGIAIDIGKYGFMAAASFNFMKRNFGWVLFFGFLSLVCITGSFIASVTYDAGNNNRIVNESITNSSIFKNQETTFNTNNQSIEDLRAEIKAREQNRQKNLDSLTAGLKADKAEAKRLNYITTPKTGTIAIQAKIDETIALYDSTTERKKTELDGKEQDLNNTNAGFKAIPGQVKITKGFMPLAELINPADPMKAFKQINFVKNALIEIIAYAFFIGFGQFAGKIELSKSSFPPPSGFQEKKKDFLSKIGDLFRSNQLHEIHENNQQQDKPTGKYDNNIINRSSPAPSDNNNDLNRGHGESDTDSKGDIDDYKRNKIGFFNDDNPIPQKSEYLSPTLQGNTLKKNDGIEEADIKAYKECMYAEAKTINKDGVTYLKSPQYKNIGYTTGIGVEKARTIKNLLKDKGIIKTEVRKPTLILIPEKDFYTTWNG